MHCRNANSFLQSQARLRKQQLLDLAAGRERNILIACGFDRVDSILATATAQQICSQVQFSWIPNFDALSNF